MYYRVVLLAGIVLILGSVLDTYAGSREGVTTSRSASVPDSEVAALRAQLEVMRQYDRRLMSTVYWSLGVLATVAIFLVGFGWFANFRLYERDKAALRLELQTTTQERLSQIKEAIRSANDEQFKAIEKHVAIAAKEAASNVQRTLEGKLQSIFIALKLLEYDSTKQEGDRATTRGVLVNAVRHYRKMMEVAIEIGWNYQISTALDHMHRALRYILDNRSSQVIPDAECIREVSETLGRIPSEHSVAASAIRELLASIRSQ